MFVLTAKVSKTKIAAIVTLVIALVVAVAVLLASRNDAPSGGGADTNEGRLAFLRGFGWEVSAEPNQTQSVTVPTKDSEVFSRYNELQKSQGYDLTPYRGKTLTRYVYEVLNYPNADQPVYATWSRRGLSSAGISQTPHRTGPCTASGSPRLNIAHNYYRIVTD